jgi:hypothetical protein
MLNCLLAGPSSRLGIGLEEVHAIAVEIRSYVGQAKQRKKRWRCFAFHAANTFLLATERLVWGRRVKVRSLHDRVREP